MKIAFETKQQSTLDIYNNYPRGQNFPFQWKRKNFASFNNVQKIKSLELLCLLDRLGKVYGELIFKRRNE